MSGKEVRIYEKGKVVRTEVNLDVEKGTELVYRELQDLCISATGKDRPCLIIDLARWCVPSDANLSALAVMLESFGDANMQSSRYEMGKVMWKAGPSKVLVSSNVGSGWLQMLASDGRLSADRCELPSIGLRSSGLQLSEQHFRLIDGLKREDFEVHHSPDYKRKRRSQDWDDWSKGGWWSQGSTDDGSGGGWWSQGASSGGWWSQDWDDRGEWYGTSTSSSSSATAAPASSSSKFTFHSKSASHSTAGLNESWSSPRMARIFVGIFPIHFP